MIKSELIESVASQMMELSPKQVAEGVGAILDLMTDTLVLHKRVEIRGFGSFSVHHRPPRKAHNPKTGKKVVTADKYIPHFKPGKELRERVDASRSHCPIEEDE